MPRKTIPKFCTWNRDRENGRLRVRFRKAGFSTYLTGVPYSDEFNAAYHAALAGVKAKAEIGAGAARTKPGSFNALIVSYYRSPEFRGLRDSTQKERRGVIERFRREHGEKPVKMLERSHIRAIIGAMADTPAAANTRLKMLRMLLDLAVNIGMIASNPTTSLKTYRLHSDGFHSWTEDEISAFEARHPIGSKARLALTLLLCTAQRRGDILRMGFQHVRGGEIAVRQQKTGAALTLPIVPELAEALALLPKTDMTFLLSERGAPFSTGGFDKWFRQCCHEAGLMRCSAHGLRKAAGRRLAEAGRSEKQIAAVMGHKSLSEVARYTKAADQSELARQAMGMPVARMRTIK